jgi:high-affinity iron transporter
MIGLVLYLGLVRVPIRKLFAVSSAVLLLIAAGMAGQMARLLEQADLLSIGSEPVWDSRWLVSTDSVLGNLLHRLAGYEAQPSAMQLAFYFGTLGLVSAGMLFSRHAMARQAICARPNVKSKTQRFSAV